MRGEYTGQLLCGQAQLGSSPHAWGIQNERLRSEVTRRFIPTCVGNTIGKSISNLMKPVHPHMRGEYSLWEMTTTSEHGSSPHAWGIPSCLPAFPTSCRFIPTCVGNTWYKPQSAHVNTVHPHMRGEYLALRFHGVAGRGSSPHAWGIPARPEHRGTSERFIPTCVGNTGIREVAEQGDAVHPHMRGEYIITEKDKDALFGSSPHAWGILLDWMERGYGERFIPTCVGNTSGTDRLPVFQPVHPHMRGEYFT